MKLSLELLVVSDFLDIDKDQFFRFLAHNLDRIVFGDNVPFIVACLNAFESKYRQSRLVILESFLNVIRDATVTQITKNIIPQFTKNVAKYFDCFSCSSSNVHDQMNLESSYASFNPPVTIVSCEKYDVDFSGKEAKSINVSSATNSTLLSSPQLIYERIFFDFEFFKEFFEDYLLKMNKSDAVSKNLTLAMLVRAIRNHAVSEGVESVKNSVIDIVQRASGSHLIFILKYFDERGPFRLFERNDLWRRQAIPTRNMMSSENLVEVTTSKLSQYYQDIIARFEDILIMLSNSANSTPVDADASKVCVAFNKSDGEIDSLNIIKATLSKLSLHAIVKSEEDCQDVNGKVIKASHQWILEIYDNGKPQEALHRIKFLATLDVAKSKKPPNSSTSDFLSGFSNNSISSGSVSKPVDRKGHVIQFVIDRQNRKY